MKLSKRLKKTGILLIAFLTLSTLSTEVFAEHFGSTLLETKRSCIASYFAMIKSFSYKSEGDRKMISIGYGKMIVPVKGYDFLISSKSDLGNPNKLRKRARDKLIECGWSHAKSLTSNPHECRNTWRYPIITRKPYYPLGGSTTRLMSVVKEHVCARPLYTTDLHKNVGINVSSLFPKTYTVEFILGIKTWGDKGCGSKNPGRFTTLDGDRHHRNVGSNARHLFTPLKKFTITCP